MNPPNPNSNLDRMRQAAANKPPPAPRPAFRPAPKPAAKKADKPAKPPLKLYKEKVVFRCGHDCTPEEIGRQDCPKCRDTKRKASGVAWREQQRAKKEKALSVLQGKPVLLRLPAGTVKTATWNGTHWAGTMTVPGVAFVFELTHVDSEEGLFRGLHDRYIRWLAKQQAAEPTPAPETPADGPQG